MIPGSGLGSDRGLEFGLLQSIAKAEQLLLHSSGEKLNTGHLDATPWQSRWIGILTWVASAEQEEVYKVYGCCCHETSCQEVQQSSRW